MLNKYIIISLKKKQQIFIITLARATLSVDKSDKCARFGGRN